MLWQIILYGSGRELFANDEAPQYIRIWRDDGDKERNHLYRQHFTSLISAQGRAGRGNRYVSEKESAAVRVLCLPGDKWRAVPDKETSDLFTHL